MDGQLPDRYLGKEHGLLRVTTHMWPMKDHGRQGQTESGFPMKKQGGVLPPIAKLPSLLFKAVRSLVFCD